MSLTLDIGHYTIDEWFFSQLQPHVPNLRHLGLGWAEDDAVRSAVFNLTTLESLELTQFFFEYIPDDIGRLIGLTRLVVEGCEYLASVSPAIGSLALLQSLELSGSALPTIPAEVLHLTRMTELRVTRASEGGIASCPDPSKLHDLKVIWARETRHDKLDSQTGAKA